MAIPSVVQGTVETKNGKVVELDSVRGATWLESIGSFRYEPAGDNKPYTVRKETGKGGNYWYGYRKVAGRLHKKYIGKSSEISTAKLEEIAEALNAPPQSRVTDKVAEVTERSERVVVEKVTDAVTVEEFTALKSEVQALQQSIEALQEGLLGKSDAGNFEELPAVTDSELQIELGNLRAENEALKQELEKVKYDYSTLVIIDKQLNQEVQELRSQLATEETRFKELEVELDNSEEIRGDVQGQLSDREAKLVELRSELSDLKQKSAPARDLPDAVDLTEKSGELLSFFKSLLPPKAKLPSGTISKIEKILEGSDD